jgi:hypothetical protein
VRQDPVRDEAERLVSAAIAAVSMAARTIPSTGSHAFATGSDDCCVCPICRVIATMRDPSAELSERLTAGAGDLATAVAGMLRTFTRGGHAEEPADSATRAGDEFWEEMRRKAADAARSAAQGVRGPGEDDPWRQATVAPTPPRMAKKAVAKKAVKKAAAPPDVEAAAPPDVEAATSSVPELPVAGGVPELPAKAAKVVAKTAVAKKAVAKKAARPPGMKAAAPPDNEAARPPAESEND